MAPGWFAEGAWAAQVSGEAAEIPAGSGGVGATEEIGVAVAVFELGEGGEKGGIDPPAAGALEGGGGDGGDDVEEVLAFELGQNSVAGGGGDGGDGGVQEDAGLGAVGLVVGAVALEAGVIEAGGDGLGEFFEEERGEIDGGVFEEEEGGFDDGSDEVGFGGWRWSRRRRRRWEWRGRRRWG